MPSQEDTGAVQRPLRGLRRKRNEYTLIACTVCKSRKVKCDGHWPCQRCTKRGDECCYSRCGNVPSTTTPMVTRMSLHSGCSPTAEEAAIAPCGSANSMRLASNEPARHSSSSGSLNSHPLPSSEVPVGDGKSPPARRSSFVDTFNLAKSCLEANGIVGPAENKDDDIQRPKRAHSLVLEKPLAFMFEDCVESILELGYDKARWLFSNFAETIYPIFPCVDLDSAGWLLDALFGRAAREANNHTAQSPPPISLTKIDIIKALLGLTILVEGDTTSPLGRHIQRHVDWTVEKLVTGTGPDTDDIVMATLMSLFFLHKSEHMKAWRLVGLASTAWYELGLHQASDENHSCAQGPPSLSLKRLFSAVYILDRTVSFMNNLPCAIKDQDIDERCFDLGASAPLVTVTIQYFHLFYEIVGSIKKSPAKSAGENRQYEEYLDYQLQRLRDQFRDLIATAQSPGSTQQDSVLMDDLETFLAVRVNHARMMLRKPLLHSYLGDREKQRAAAVSIECAKDTVFLCSRFISKPTSYKCLRGAYEYFLVSSLAMILLIVSQDPRTYGPDSREAFQEAIKILEATEFQHFGSQNLCFTVEQLIKIGDHLYMPKDINVSVSPDFGDFDLAQFWFDPQCATPNDTQTLDNNIFNLFGINRSWPANVRYV